MAVIEGGNVRQLMYVYFNCEHSRSTAAAAATRGWLNVSLIYEDKRLRCSCTFPYVSITTDLLARRRSSSRCISRDSFDVLGDDAQSCGRKVFDITTIASPSVCEHQQNLKCYSVVKTQQDNVIAFQSKADHPQMCVHSYARLTFIAAVTLTLTR